MPADSADRAAQDCPVIVKSADLTGWELGVAEYRAGRSGGRLVVRVKGMNPTPGFELRLVLQPDGSIAFYRKRPEGIRPQVLAPFNFCGSLNSSAEKVTVVDRSGRHEVSIGPIP